MQTGDGNRRIIGGDEKCGKREVVLFFVMGSFLLSGCHTTNQDIQQNTDSTASESTFCDGNRYFCYVFR